MMGHITGQRSGSGQPLCGVRLPGTLICPAQVQQLQDKLLSPKCQQLCGFTVIFIYIFMISIQLCSEMNQWARIIVRYQTYPSFAQHLAVDILTTVLVGHQLGHHNLCCKYFNKTSEVIIIIRFSTPKIKNTSFYSYFHTTSYNYD